MTFLLALSIVSVMFFQDAGAVELAALMTNTTNGLATGDEYVDTDAAFETVDGVLTLRLREIYRAALTGRARMTETRAVALRAVEKIALHADGRLKANDRHVYLLLTYRADARNADAYGFQSEGTHRMGALKTARFGVYNQERAERIKAALERMIAAERN